MLISVIVPCYNCSETIERCYTSIVGQTYKELEIIFVDDGSSDDTWELLSKLKIKDSRVYIYRKENGGSLSARKQGVYMAHGEYILFCDADDYISEDLVERVSELIFDKDADMIAFGSTAHFPNGEEKIIKNRLESGFYSKEALEKDILPCLMFNGAFNSGLISGSMCNKAYRYGLIKEAISTVNESVLFGEDALVNFVAEVKMSSLYCCNDIYGYQIVRNTLSKTGDYNPNIFGLIDKHYDEKERLGNILSYNYPDQIDMSIYCNYLMYIKKVIARSPLGKAETIKLIRGVIESEHFKKCSQKCNISQFSIKEKTFARLVNAAKYKSLYMLVRLLTMKDKYSI